jgi:hypothetical protein
MPSHVNLQLRLGSAFAILGVSLLCLVFNKYYNGQVWKTNDGWRHDLNPKTILQGDDVQIILDLIEENSNKLTPPAKAI